MNQAEVIKGCLKNDRESQRILYEEFYNNMFGICLRYAKNAEEAKEILHQGFLKVFTNLKNFKSTSSLHDWIKRIIISNAVEFIRNNKHDYLIVSTVYANDQRTHVGHEISDGALAVKINQKELLDALHQLTPAYRTVFNLYVIDEYTHAEIAEMLDVSEATSKANLAKAKFNLRKNLIQLIKSTGDNGK